MACVATLPLYWHCAEYAPPPPQPWQIAVDHLLADVSALLIRACAPGEELGLRAPKALPLPCAREAGRDACGLPEKDAELPARAQKVSQLPVAVLRRERERNGEHEKVDFENARGVRECKGGKKKAAKKAVPLSLAPTNNSGGDGNGGDAPPAEGGGDGGSGDAGDAGDGGGGDDNGEKSKKEKEEEAERIAKEKEEEEKKAAEASAANNLSWADDAGAADDGWFDSVTKKKNKVCSSLVFYSHLIENAL